MYCKECGEVIDLDSKYCSYCGTKQPQNSPAMIPPSIHTRIKHPAPSEDDLLSDRKVNISSNGQVFFKDVQEQPKNGKYDLTYKKEIGASIAGLVVLFVLSIILAIAIVQDNSALFALYKVLLLVWWLTAFFLVLDISRRQNRNRVGWGFFAFFFPFLPIIIIGFLGKLIKPLPDSS